MLSGIEKYRIIKNIVPYNKYGNTLRLVDDTDADFIFQLRTNPRLSRFIHKVSDKIEDQINWIREYKKREQRGEEFYFISFNPETNARQGLNRIYNFRDDIFELGSWLYTPDENISISILGDIAVREIAYDILQFSTCTFEVRKSNKSVIRYHSNYEPILIGEDDENYYYKLTKEAFNKNKAKILKIFGYGLD